MSFDIPIIVACAVALVSWVLYARSPKQSHPFPPGPPRTAVIGNARQVPAHHKEVAFAEWGKKYGAFKSLCDGAEPIMPLRKIRRARDRVGGDYCLVPFACDLEHKQHADDASTFRFTIPQAQ